MILETPRLILRPMTIEDAPAVFDYSRHQEVGPNAGWEPHKSLDETKSIMADVFLGQPHVFAVVLKENDLLIASIGLIDDPKRQNPKAKMVGYALGRDYWNRGIITEALKEIIDYGFNTLGLDLISAYCYPHNQRSQRVLEKQGFSYEGRLQQCEELYNGKIYDNLCYILLNPEK